MKRDELIALLQSCPSNDEVAFLVDTSTGFGPRKEYATAHVTLCETPALIVFNVYPKH